MGQMNLRSVFTAEQQRILQRYYENGMTNQSKNCFQLILQCAQETKLDFSVVRTWVGNKRRKMSSKNVVDSGGTPSGTVASTLTIPSEVAVRNVVSIARSQSQQSSWTSSNNDVIVTGIYNPASSSGRLVSAKQTNTLMSDMHKNSFQRPPGKSDPEFQRQHIAVARQAPHCKNASLFLGEKTIILSRQTSVLNSANSIYNHTKKSYGGSSVQTAELVLPQKPVLCHRPCRVEQMGCQRLQKPEHPILASHMPSGQRANNVRDPSCSTHNLEIREVFSLAVTDQPQRILGGNAQKSLSTSREASCLSIAMETGDVDDEYAREEELASMGAQIQNYSRLSGSSLRAENPSTGLSGSGRSVSCSSHMVNARDLHDNILYHNRDYRLPPRTSLHTTSSTLYSSSYPSRSNLSSHFAASNQLRLSQNQNNYQISGNLTVPWITGCSRKRALQDRTQFSDRDLATLKKYWDKGMTSLGSVCREKIEAVAAELNVDCEIVRTWIGNRRRKYRLMGIQVPPPRGGPADFSNQSDSSSRSIPIPGDDASTDVGDDNDRNDDVSICLSEGSSQEEHSEVLQSEDLGLKEGDRTTVSTDNVKIEIIDDEESDMISNSEVDQMSSLLDYKNEEVRFIENELELQKQKYFELQAFTRSLILAIKTDDKEQQQALLADLPSELEDIDFNHASPEPDDTSFSLSSSSEKNALDSL
ncbi:highly divergent homeobox isoform X3 [Pogona vitticeps]|uniref:Highly divergent homeobox isoform X2 n=1 Tax=Pogona vitticeps TaxID=103695 RepID=A0A6J0UZK1_9SAUR|nr:highly divergent homeobox isoform X3 [Pogona vitticeps]